MAIARRSNPPKKFKVKRKPPKRENVTPYNLLLAKARALPADKLTPSVVRAVTQRAHTLAGAPKLNTYTSRRNQDITGAPTAITAYCAGCQCAVNKPDENLRVLECLYVTCPLWAFRLGNDPLHGKKTGL